MDMNLKGIVGAVLVATGLVAVQAWPAEPATSPQAAIADPSFSLAEPALPSLTQPPSVLYDENLTQVQFSEFGPRGEERIPRYQMPSPQVTGFTNFPPIIGTGGFQMGSGFPPGSGF